MTVTRDDREAFARWMQALEERHLSNLRLPEVTRALRALSSAYVERRHTIRSGAALDSAGKRAAFALFYAPLHFLAVSHVARALNAPARPPRSVLDIGCGTGSAGAAWALACGNAPGVSGVDRHAWAVDEARWTYRQLGIRGRSRREDITRLPALSADAIVAAYVLNELPPDSRLRLEQQLFDAATKGSRVLVVEPLSRAITPWWGQTAERAATLGGRSDEWRFAPDLPPLTQLLDKAAGLDHRELTLRTLFLPGT